MTETATPPAELPGRRLEGPTWPVVSRGLGLLFLALVALWATGRSVRALGVLAAPIAPLTFAIAVLAAWAGVIHVTGGERFDDHPAV
jgi:hypothetical protein